jgi:hypothetical protein
MDGPDMDPADPAALAREVDLLLEALEAERFRHLAGLEPEPALVRLFDARSAAAHRATVAALRERGDGALAAVVARLRAERAQAEDEERWRAAEVVATGVGPDGVRPLAALEHALAREPDRTRRLALARAAAEALERAAGDRERAVETRARAAAEVGLVPDWPLVVAGDGFLGATDDAWRDVLAWSARRALGVSPRPDGDLRRADLLHLFSLPRWDGLFRPGMLAVALKLATEALGLELGRIRVDDADRAAQWPGAHAVGARVSLRRRGGAPDWQDLFRAAGSALAAAHHPPRLRDATFGAALGALLDGLLLEPRFLAAHADVEKRHATDLVRDLALRTLFRLRVHAAALRIATEVERGLSGAAWREAYRDALSDATGAEWDGARAARDADATEHGTALAGAGLAARWRVDLRERFDEDWWRNPRTAGWLAGLLAAGDAGITAAEGEGGGPAGLDLVARDLVERLR